MSEIQSQAGDSGRTMKSCVVEAETNLHRQLAERVVVVVLQGAPTTAAVVGELTVRGRGGRAPRASRSLRRWPARIEDLWSDLISPADSASVSIPCPDRPEVTALGVWKSGSFQQRWDRGSPDQGMGGTQWPGCSWHCPCTHSSQSQSAWESHERRCHSPPAWQRRFAPPSRPGSWQGNGSQRPRSLQRTAAPHVLGVQRGTHAAGEHQHLSEFGATAPGTCVRHRISVLAGRKPVLSPRYSGRNIPRIAARASCTLPS